MEHSITLSEAARDYELVRQNLDYLREHWREQPSLDLLAERNGLSAAHLQRLFMRWAGLSPKAFVQALTIDHARKLLRDSASVLEASYEVGLSGPGRLHDLFISHEGMSPVADMRRRWPEAQYVEDPAATAPPVARIFDPQRWAADQPLRIVFIGTDFETRVWQTLLKIPLGKATTYSDIAGHLGNPKASRAVGTAVGRNPISFVVPCHRVLGKSGSLCGYHWGLTRKQAILGWEAGLLSGAPEAGWSGA